MATAATAPAGIAAAGNSSATATATATTAKAAPIFPARDRPGFAGRLSAPALGLWSAGPLAEATEGTREPPEAPRRGAIELYSAAGVPPATASSSLAKSVVT